MAVFRVEKNKGYTIMSNHHLRNPTLSLKSKGLLSQMLSLPEGWTFTLSGLTQINREKIDAIREAVRELERAGYITRSRERDDKGRLRGADYVIYEHPQPPTLENPILDKPTPKKPTLENPMLENPTLGNPTQLNKDIPNTDLLITDVSAPSFPIHSLPALPETAAPERKGSRNAHMDGIRAHEEAIKENIEYGYLCQDPQTDRRQLDEILSLILETVCTSRRTIRIAGDDYPAELVKSKFMKLDSGHIRFVISCMKQNTTQIRNMKKYLLAALFNAPTTIEHYYSAMVNHDLHGTD